MTFLLINARLVRLRMMTNKVLSSRKSHHLGTRVFIRNAPGIGGGNSSKLAADIGKAATTVGQKASTQATPAATKLVQNINPTTNNSNSNLPKVTGIPAAMLGNYSSTNSSATYSSISASSLIPPGLVKPISNTTTSSSLGQTTIPAATPQPSVNQSVKTIFGTTPISLSTTTSSASVVNPNLTGLHLKNSEVNLYQIITGPLAGKLFCGIPLRDGSNNLTGFTFGRIFSTKRNFRDVKGNLDYNEPIDSTTLKSFPGIQFASPVMFQKDSSLGQPTYLNNQAPNTTLRGKVEQDVCFWAKHFSKGLNRFSSFVTNALNGEIDPKFDYDPNNR